MTKPVALTEDQLKDVEKRAQIGFPYAISAQTIHAMVAMCREFNAMKAAANTPAPSVYGL